MAEFNGILYRKAGGNTELNRSVGGFCVVESAKLEDRWQDGGTIDLSLTMSGTMTFYDGDYVVVKGRPYEVRETISEYTTIDDTRNKYTLKLHYPDIRFKRAIMYNTVEQYNEGVYSWSRPNNTIVTEGSFETLVETCCYNANEVANERVFKVGTISEDIETDFRVLSFSDNNCWAALKQICEEYGTFYTIRANTDIEPDSLYIIDFGVEVGTFPQTIKIGKNQGISELKLNYSDSNVYTQFIVLGSTENLPSAYAEERLQLDTNTEATPPVYDHSMMVKDDKYTRWGRKRMELIYEDIKPSRTGTITGLPENNIFAFYDTDLSAVIAEEPTWNPVGGTVHVVEGPLLGYTFEIVGWHAETQKITIKQIADSNGYKLPNEDSEVFRFTVGTKYNLADIRLPESYVTDAKTRLKTRAITGIEYWSQPRASYTLTVDPFFTRKEETELVCGMLIPIVHTAMDIDKSIRIKRIEYDLLKDKYFDVEDIIISDLKTDDSWADATHRQIATTAHRLDDVDKTSSNIKTVIKNLDTYIDGAFADGLVSQAEAKAIEKYINIVNSQKSDIDAQFTALYANSYLSGNPKTNLNSAKEALNTSVSNLLDSIAMAITDGTATTAEKADVDSKFTAFNAAISTYQTRVEQAQEAINAAMKTAAENASKHYADSLADVMDADTTAKVTAAKNALAAKFGYTDWAAMEAAVSLIGGMTTSAGLINANVIDVTTLAALEAFINSLTVIKLETAVDEDETKVRIDADAVDGRAGVLLEEKTGNRGIKLYYKASNGAPIFYLYSTDTSEFLEFLANRMKFAKGSAKDVTIDSDSTILQLRNSTNYAQITPTSLRVDGLATAPVGTGHFWVDTSTGIVHWGIVTPPTVTYSFDIQETYPSGRSDIAASGGVATFTVKLITTTNGTPDAGVLVDLDSGYPAVASSPTGTNFSITKTGTGTYSITAASRGTVESVSTAAVISVKYTPSGATQQSTSFNILQEANSKTKTDEDTGITLSISTKYDDTNCAASGDTWTVTASGESGGREEYTYTSGESEWVSLGGTTITASLISITTSGTGLSGSGTGAGTSVTWADRETTTGERRSGIITASYSGESVQETVYQGRNVVESVTDKVINWVKLDGVNGNIEVDADAGYTYVTVELGYTNHYTSGSTYSDTYPSGHTLSVSGTGFSKYFNGRVNYTENTSQSTRNGVITITYGDATPVQRTITQAAASATTYQILGEIAYASGSQIAASGGTATLTVTKQTYINGVHQSASDVLIDCDSGYPDLVSQPTGCDVSITRTTTGTYSLSADSRGTVVNSGTEIEIDLASTVEGSLKTDSVTLVQQANALASSTNYQITSVTLDGVNDDIDITKSAQTITVLGSGTYTKTYTSGSSESATFNLGASDISVSGTGFSYSNFQISAAANSGAERTCTVTASYTGATSVQRTITQAMGIVAPSLSLDTYSLSGNTLTLKASISSAGGGTITDCGFEYLVLKYEDDGYYSYDVPVSAVQSGQFTADISVISGQTIYWGAYATNEAGTTYTTMTGMTIPN